MSFVNILKVLIYETPLTTNASPFLSLPTSLGFAIASDTAYSNGLSGLVDNVLLTDLRDPIAQYPLNTGLGSIAYDSVDSYDGSIINGIWAII